MNGIIKKKLNLLVHLARIDGDFHRSEKEMIYKLAVDKNVLIESDVAAGNPLDNIDKLSDKEEILYLALKLIQADAVITKEELIFCRKLAVKLGFREEVIDKFAYLPMPTMSEFVLEAKRWTVDNR